MCECKCMPVYNLSNCHFQWCTFNVSREHSRPHAIFLISNCSTKHKLYSEEKKLVSINIGIVDTWSDKQGTINQEIIIKILLCFVLYFWNSILLKFQGKEVSELSSNKTTNIQVNKGFRFISMSFAMLKKRSSNIDVVAQCIHPHTRTYWSQLHETRAMPFGAIVTEVTRFSWPFKDPI